VQRIKLLVRQEGLIEVNMFLFFNDLKSGENFKNGLQFHAAGIIEKDYRKNGKPSLSGKDFIVSYIDPWGNNSIEWRSENEIEIFEVGREDFEYLKHCIKTNEY
jgi:hypothetical protein